MSALFSPQFKYSCWRRLWVALAKAEQKVGLPITDGQIAAMEKKTQEIDYVRVAEIEKKTRHDVMAHLHAFGEVAPEAKGIIHLGATSTFVTDNTDLIVIREGLSLLRSKLHHLLNLMGEFANKTKGIATLGYTHFQPAQPTTVGKRTSLWLQDFLLDAADLYRREIELPFLGVRGATGTESAFLTLLDGDHKKVEELNDHVAKEMGFEMIFPVCGQTYTRKEDVRVFSSLQALASSAHKCATDVRLLAHLGEIAEGFGKEQVGSSAMPHKRNPIVAERICSLSRFLLSLAENPAYTHATQWLERSLDDSAGRRIVIPEGFLTADAILNLLIHLFTHLEVFPALCQKNLEKEIPALALETILMYSVKKGKDRQEVHEKLRKIHREGKDLLQEIPSDPSMGLTKEEVAKALAPNVGRAKEQVEEFLHEMVHPFLQNHPVNEAPIFPIEV